MSERLKGAKNLAADEGGEKDDAGEQHDERNEGRIGVQEMLQAAQEPVAVLLLENGDVAAGLCCLLEILRLAGGLGHAFPQAGSSEGQH